MTEDTSGSIPVPVQEVEIVQGTDGNVPLYNPNDGLHGRTGGPYLDELELKEAEIRRAAAENREPNFDNMAGSAGVRLVTAEQLASATVISTVSVTGQDNASAVADMIDHLAHTPNVGPQPVYVPEDSVVAAVQDVPAFGTPDVQDVVDAEEVPA